MQEVHPAPEAAPRHGLEGEQFDLAVTAFVTVFALGFAVIGVVLLSRKKKA